MWFDPSQGAGAFYKNFGDVKKIWCEVEKGRDFFDFPKCMKGVVEELDINLSRLVICTNPR